MAANKPKYMVLVDWVKEEINQGKLMPGQKLNSEHELAGMFRMSRQTVRHAIDVLVSEGIIEKKRGSGTYISNFFRKEYRESTMNIAIVTTYVDDYIFPSIIQGVEKVISEAGYTMQVAFTHNSVEKERMVLKNILDKNLVDGLLIETTKSGIPNPNMDLYHELAEKQIPALFLHSSYEGIDIPHVSLNDRKTGRMITEYLINRGHRKIAGIFKCDDGQGHARYAGYSEALMEHGIQVMDESVVWIDTEDLTELHVIARKIVRRLKHCTACICYNDDVASQLVPILEKQGISVPEDMSLISVDNSELAEKCSVPLTSVVHPMDLLGVRAAGNLLAMIQSPDVIGTFEFEPELCERNSVKNID